MKRRRFKVRKDYEDLRFVLKMEDTTVKLAHSRSKIHELPFYVLPREYQTPRKGCAITFRKIDD